MDHGSRTRSQRAGTTACLRWTLATGYIEISATPLRRHLDLTPIPYGLYSADGQLATAITTLLTGFWFVYCLGLRLFIYRSVHVLKNWLGGCLLSLEDQELMAATALEQACQRDGL